MYRVEAPSRCRVYLGSVVWLDQRCNCGSILRQTDSVARDGRDLKIADRGKSELHRVGCQVTPGRRETTVRATENIPPVRRVRVKWWGKSLPRGWQQAWHGNPQPEQGQVSGDGSTRAA